jgi:molybdopterin-guanine dinucleotide biosynthesis protein A
MQAAGFVLTGGGSTRMGRDKALLPYKGSTLVEWVAAQVQAVTGSVILVGGADRYSQLAIPCISESYAGDGPLSGLEAALSSQHAADWNLVVACDMPGLRPDALQLVLAACREGFDVAAAAGPKGRPEPLCAAYHVRLLPLFRDAIRQRKLKLINILEEVRVCMVNTPSAAALSNVNTVDEWAGWEAGRP